MLCIKINQALSNTKNIMFNGIGAALLAPSSLASALIPEIQKDIWPLLSFLLTEQKVFYLLHPIGYLNIGLD